MPKLRRWPSFSRPGNPYDNALPGTTQAAAGWSTLKTESLRQGGAFANLEEARLEGAHCLDTCFNLDRRHFAPGYRLPRPFEQDLKTPYLGSLFVFTEPPQTTPSRGLKGNAFRLA